jgi:tRNA threonylcarbamoyladenosine biosynthesis protein TsaB
MVILALDTATDRGSLALMAEERLLGEVSLESQGAYLTRLLPGLEGLLGSTGLHLEDLEAIAVSRGPGNFTGLRIGLATAKTLAFALGCPLVGLSTLETLAAQFPCQPLPVGVLIDAKRQEVYLGLYSCQEAEPQPLGEPVRLPVAALPQRLQPPLLLTGPGLTVYGDTLAGALHREIHWAPPEMRSLRAPTLARLARLRLQQGLTTPPQQLIPDYLRPAL